MSATSAAALSASSRRWLLTLALAFMAGVASVLFFLLLVATDHRAFEASAYRYLVWLNIGVAAVLAAALLWLAARLVGRWRKQRFGSQLLVKLAAIFALVGFLPGVLIYVVSYQFVSRSIETWFDVRVETALTAGLSLGRSTLDTLAADWASKTRNAASTLHGSGNMAAALALEQLREQLQAQDVILWGSNGLAIASAGESRFQLLPDPPSAALLRQVRQQRVLAAIEGLEEFETLADPQALLALPPQQLPKVRALALVAPASFALSGEARFLQVSAPLPAALVANALSVQLANRQYQERALARDSLRSMYIGTLTLALFLSIFAAVLLAVLLGMQLVRPLLVLAEGMREVARGDLTPKPALTAKDELAGLTRTFAHMTQELLEARSSAQKSMGQVDAARASLQTLLDNLTAGVVVLDARHRVLSSNPGAARILGVALAHHLGQDLANIVPLQAFAQAVRSQFDRFVADASAPASGHWQHSIDLGEQITLIARGALLPNGDHLLVFDDVSDLISAQRTQAWGEVARRLAHEIKNPLTPIQLSAERLQLKLAPHLQDADLAVLHKSVKTIVDQVDAMKRLVNEFRDYARLPSAQLQAVDLNALLQDIAGLYEAATTPVQLELAPSLPAVWADPQQVRQVVHNLVQNAQDAQDAQDGTATPTSAGSIIVRTRLSQGAQRVRLWVLDHGPGFAPAILKRAFEPYVTTKAKGTGLGLAVVKKIMDEHGGRVEIGPRPDAAGAQVSLSFRVAHLHGDLS